MSQAIAIAAGGAIGALLRFWTSGWVYSLLGRGFPWGTLAVNVIGSLAMGLCYVWFMEKSALGPEWRAFVMVGLLGAFTTFSTFSIETFNHIESGELATAITNMVASVVVCVLAAWLGVLAGRQL